MPSHMVSKWCRISSIHMQCCARMGSFNESWMVARPPNSARPESQLLPTQPPTWPAAGDDLDDESSSSDLCDELFDMFAQGVAWTSCLQRNTLKHTAFGIRFVPQASAESISRISARSAKTLKKSGLLAAGWRLCTSQRYVDLMLREEHEIRK